MITSENIMFLNSNKDVVKSFMKYSRSSETDLYESLLSWNEDIKSEHVLISGY